MQDYIAGLRKAVEEYDMEGIEKLAQEALKAGVDPLRAIEDGLAVGIRRVGERFGAGELFLPELVMAAEAMRAGMRVIEPRLPQGAQGRKTRKIVLATVQDDIHEIGKNLVATMLTANGYEVVDMGVNQPTDAILAKASDLEAEVVGVSALMTTSMPRMKELLSHAEEKQLRSRRRFIVGGAPVTEQYAEEIGSDGSAGDAAGAVHLVRRLVGDGA